MAQSPSVSHKEKYTSDIGITYNVEYYLLTNYAGVNIDSEKLSVTVHYIRFDDKINSFEPRINIGHYSEDQDLISHMNKVYKTLLKIKAFV